MGVVRFYSGNGVECVGVWGGGLFENVREIGFGCIFVCFLGQQLPEHTTQIFFARLALRLGTRAKTSHSRARSFGAKIDLIHHNHFARILVCICPLIRGNNHPDVSSL